MRLLEGKAAESAVARLENRCAEESLVTARTVRKIVAEVRRRGDRALRAYAVRLDGLRPKDTLRVPVRAIEGALRAVSADFLRALETAAANIRQFCKLQKPAEFTRETLPGLRVGQLVRPLESVGCYVPGGRYPLPSSLLMTVIPAQVAGVERIAVATPRPAAEILAAAGLLGISEIYSLGGAQAIAAFAYGTTTIPRVTKIVGPGNRFVTAA